MRKLSLNVSVSSCKKLLPKTSKKSTNARRKNTMRWSAPPSNFKKSKSQTVWDSQTLTPQRQPAQTTFHTSSNARKTMFQILMSLGVTKSWHLTLNRYHCGPWLPPLEASSNIDCPSTTCLNSVTMTKKTREAQRREMNRWLWDRMTTRIFSTMLSSKLIHHDKVVSSSR